MSRVSSPYLLRPLCAEDEGRLQEFFRSHTEETIQSRYGHMVSTLTHERAQALVNVDQVRDVALGIFEGSGDAQILHAVGRYYTEGDTRIAEIAFVVRESQRNQGMATTLLRELAATARQRGLETFCAQVLRDNRAMRRIFDRYHPVVEPVPGSSCLTYKIPIDVILGKDMSAG